MNGRSQFIGCALAWLVLAAGLVAPARGGAPPNLLLNDPSPPPTPPALPQTQCTPVIRSFGDKVVAVWTDVRVGGNAENKFHYAVSLDSGATFVDAGQPPTFSDAGVSYFWRSNPQLVIDPSNGKVFIAGVGLSQSGPLQSALGIVEGTFSGSTLIWSTPRFIRLVSVDALAAVSMEMAPGGLGLLHILMADAGAIRYLRSIDGDGLVWTTTPAVLSSVADQGSVAFPKLVAGINNDFHAAWTAGVTVASQPIRYRSSNNLGVSWNSEETAATMRINPAMPGAGSFPFVSSVRYGFSMGVNRVAGSSTIGRVALAWGETWNFADEPFPALTGTFLRNEVEPDDNAAGAVAFTPGDALLGTMSSSTDQDFWKTTLAAGDPVLIWCDSTNSISRVSVVDSDGSTFLITGGVGVASRAFSFRAPYAGTFHLFISSGTTGFYRVRTRIGSPQPGEAQDSRDVTVAYRDGGWSSPLHLPLGPIGYDDYLPTIGFGADGLDYVTWYDLSRLPGHSQSHLVAARNLCGLDPVPSLPEVVTTAPTDWAAISVFVPPAMGITNDVWGDPRRVHLAWADGRDHTPDAYAARLATTAAMVSCAIDTAVSPGTTAMLRIRVQNRNSLFQEKDLVTASGARSWPGGAVTSDFVAPGATGFLIVPVAVPDTAAAGVYPLTLALKRQSGIPLGNCQVSLTITAVTAVADPRGFRFELGSIIPNPAHGPVHVDFTLPVRGSVRVGVYGLQGNRVRTLMDSERDAGTHNVTWDGRDDRGRLAPTGMYLIKAQALSRTATRLVVILR